MWRWRQTSDNLLIALGAIGPMDLHKFDNILAEVCLNKCLICDTSSFRTIRFKAIRILDSLGHCEFNYDENRVYPYKPCIVALPGGPFQRAVLTGVRSKSTVEEINKYKRDLCSALEVNTYPQYIFDISVEENALPLATLPSTVSFDAMEIGELEGLAKYIGAEISLDIPAAWLLANYSGSLEDYRSELQWNHKRVLEWPRRVFSMENLSFQRQDVKEYNAEGLVEYVQQFTNQKLHYLWKDGVAARVDRDWGRYLSIAEKGAKVLLYDKRSHHLIVPSFTPLPRLLARAATLCSGRAPISSRLMDTELGDIPQNTPVEVYSGVPPEYAKLITSKLSQRPVDCKIEVDLTKVKIR